MKLPACRECKEESPPSTSKEVMKAVEAAVREVQFGEIRVIIRHGQAREMEKIERTRFD